MAEDGDGIGLVDFAVADHVEAGAAEPVELHIVQVGETPFGVVDHVVGDVHAQPATAVRSQLTPNAAHAAAQLQQAVLPVDPECVLDLVGGPAAGVLQPLLAEAAIHRRHGGARVAGFEVPDFLVGVGVHWVRNDVVKTGGEV